MKINYLMIPMLAAALLAGCKQAPQGQEETVVDTSAIVSESAAPEIPEAQLVPVIRDVKRPAPQKTATPAAKRAPKEPAETLYVETDGAQGRVWGHVTMQGDRGTGTIHDWDENTLAVSVTRHGNELYAVDQNSRQYVFKLKQNKIQE